MSKVYGRGPLTVADHTRITELADAGWAATRIAKEIKKHPATVAWFMYSNGLRAPKRYESPRKPYMRKGRLVHTFSTEEDALIESLRLRDFPLATIADVCTKRFGTNRTHHTIRCRLIMLAAREDAA